MSELANLQIKVESDGTQKAERELNKLEKQAAKTEKAAEGVGKGGSKAKKGLKGFEDQARKTERSTNSLESGLKGVGGALAAYFTVQTAYSIIQTAESFSLLQARVARLSDSSDDAASKYQALTDIAIETGSNLRTTVRLWENLDQTLGELGKSDADILQLTDTLNKLGIIGGSSADEMSYAMRQLGQAMAGGILRAEEYNSIIENTPEIARAMARGLDMSMGQMRAAMLDGELTATMVFNALKSQTGDVNTEFEKMPRTTAMAAEALKTNFGNAISALDEKLGVSDKVVWFFDFLSKEAQILEQSLAPDNQRKFQALHQDLVQLKKDYEALNHINDPGGRRKDLLNAQITQIKSEMAALQELRKQDIIKSGDSGSDNDKPKPIDPASQSWLEEIRKRNLTELQLLDEKQAEELEKLKAHLESENVTKQQYADAKLAIDKHYQDEKERIQLREQELREREAERARQEQARKQQEADTFLMSIEQNNMTELELIQAQYDSKKQMLDDYLAEDLLTKQEHEAGLTALAQTAANERNRIEEQRIAQQMQWEQQAQQMQMSLIANGMGLVASNLEEGSAAWVAATLAQKGIMVAQAIMAANLAHTQALATIVPGTGPAGVAAATTAANGIRAMGYANAAMIGATAISDIAGARSHGGQVMGGSTYLVGERGPELLTMPGSGAGSITPNHKLNQGGATTVNVINNTGEQAETRRSTDGNGNEVIDIIIGKLSDQVERGIGFGGTLQQTYGLNRRL